MGKRKFHNWETEGVLESIKNQGKEPICWSFVTTEFLGVSANIKKVGDHKWVLSRQELIDCCNQKLKKPYSLSFEKALNYVLVNGIRQEKDYPFVHGVKNACRPKTEEEKSNVLKIKKIKRVNYRNEDEMMEVVLRNPITGCINITHEFLALKDEVYIPTDNYIYRVDENGNRKIHKHAVLVVGFYYEEKMKTAFWIIKNSWGEQWGEEGYGKIGFGERLIGLTSELFPIRQTFDVEF